MGEFRIKIELLDDQKLFFFSDPHFNHTNIVRGITSWRNKDGSIPIESTRDFQTLSHMNDTLVNNINEVIGENDIIFCLGDWSFGGLESIKEFRNRIICQNVYHVLGNHCEKIRDNIEGCKGYFKKVFPSYCELEVVKNGKTKNDKKEKFHFVLSHYPLASWNNMNRGYYHLFGHVHLPNHMKFLPGRGMDVGVDGNNLKPYEMREIINLLKERPIQSLFLFDHHLDEISQSK